MGRRAADGQHAVRGPGGTGADPQDRAGVGGARRARGLPPARPAGITPKASRPPKGGRGVSPGMPPPLLTEAAGVSLPAPAPRGVSGAWVLIVIALLYSPIMLIVTAWK